MSVVSTSSLRLVWEDRTSNEAGFVVERSSDGVAFTQVAKLGSNVTSYTDAGLNPGSTYFYRVGVVSPKGGVSYSKVVSGTTSGSSPEDTTPPTAPGAFTASALSTSSIQLAWQASTDDVAVAGYRLWRGATEIASLPASASSYTDSGLSAATTYSYAIRAVDASGNVSASATASATTQSGTGGVTPTGNFSFDATGRIFDPDGKLFVPIGVNANGPNWVWAEPTIGKSAAMTGWKFNTLRVNTCLPEGCLSWANWTTNNDLDALVQEYTSKKHVIMIAMHSYGAGENLTDTNLSKLESWWQTTAAKYKSNPYVWFNLINEPTTEGASDLPRWLSITRRLATAVRSVAPENVIVVDGNAWGQEKGTWSCGGTDWFRNSGFINHGQQLKSEFGRVVFSFHVYGMWGGNEAYGCGPAQWDADLDTFITKVQSLGLPLLAGEAGANPVKANEDWATGGSWNAVNALFRVFPQRKIGVLFWHGSPGTYMNLFSPAAPWYDYQTATKNWMGQGMWDYAQQLSP